MNKLQDLTGVRRSNRSAQNDNPPVHQTVSTPSLSSTMALPADAEVLMSSEETRTKENKQSAMFSFFENMPFFLLVALAFLSPIFVLPGTTASFGMVKMLVLTFLVAGALAFWIINNLRTGTITLPRTWIIPAALSIPCAFLVSALFSDAPWASVFGASLEPGTAFFLLVCAALFSLALATFHSRARIFVLYAALLSAFVLMAFFHFSRFVFGYEFLSFGILTTGIANLVGKWNDVAIFTGLVTLLSLAALEVLPTYGMVRRALYLLLAVSLVLIAVVNFNTVWIMLGVFAFLLAGVVFRMRTHAGVNESDANGGTPATLGIRLPKIALAVCAIAVFFAIAGQPIGDRLAEALDISHLEARPSFSSTAMIARAALQTPETVLFGVGPNRFFRPWLNAKPSELNETPFWNIDFNFGVGLLPTFAITAGVAGLLAWTVFLVFFVKMGIGAVMARRTDRSWSFIILSSIVGALFLWTLSVVYVPNGVNISLAFLLSGVAVAGILREREVVARTFIFGASRFGFIVSLVLLLLLGGTVWGGYITLERFAASGHFGRGIEALATGDTASALSSAMAAVDSAALDRHYRLLAQVGIERLRELAARPTEEATVESLRTEFRGVLEQAVDHARLATEYDPNNYENWAIRGAVYGFLVPFGVDGAYENADSAYERAIDLNPMNPALLLDRARLAFAGQETDLARTYIAQALERKNNYTEAVFFLSQLEGQQGNMEEAKASAEIAATLAPNDPIAFFHLGLLRYNDEEYETAAASFERAVSLKNDYANARYFLGLSYERMGRRDAAIVQFVEIEKTNADNEEVKQILANLRAGMASFPSTSESTSAELPEERDELPIEEE